MGTRPCRPHPYRSAPRDERTRPPPRADRLDYGLLVAMSLFCSMPIIDAMQREGRLDVEGSFALLLLGALLRTAYVEHRSARRAHAAEELLRRA